MTCCISEIMCKESNDNPGVVWVDGAIIVGAGPAGLAAAVCLKRNGLSCIVLEKTDCIASLWRNRAYDRLCLHIPKQFCELPFMPFLPSFPKFPSRCQFLAYLEEYAQKFSVHPRFNENVTSAKFDEKRELWNVLSESRHGTKMYVARWLVVASGENAEPVFPSDLPGLENYSRETLHSSQYKNGEEFRGKRVLVIGCGNSGMEVSLDLANFGAKPAVSIRSPVHILPREIFGISTFAIAMALTKCFSVRWTDRLLVLLSRIILGDTSRYGFRKPSSGPLELKETLGKTPLLDVGTLTKIKDGSIEVVPAVQKLTSVGCFFMDGSYGDFDAVILATGYKSNVPAWLKVDENSIKGSCWKGQKGLYFAGFSGKGLLGISMDARRIATMISKGDTHR